VTNDIVQHLVTVDILKDHIVMMSMNDHLSHAADIRVVEKRGECGLAQSPDLLGCIFRSLICGSLWG
jgi:hypothetical protein